MAALSQFDASRALANVEERAARVHTGSGRRHVVVRLVPLRRRDPLEDPGWRSRAVTTNGEDPAAPIRERNLENGCAVRPSPPADVVDEAHIGLVVGALPADQRRDGVGAAPTGRGPCASPVRRTGSSSACGRDEVTGSCERDRVTIGSRRRSVTAGIYGCRGYPGRADDVPANVLLALPEDAADAKVVRSITTAPSATTAPSPQSRALRRMLPPFLVRIL